MARHDDEAYQFPDEYEPLPELAEELDGLFVAGRYESALEVALEHLRVHGRSPVAFEWSLLFLGTWQSTPDPSVVEPVTERQHSNPYFAPLATECAGCGLFWYSRHISVDGRDGRMAVTNPIGLQCPTCRYTLCRDCLARFDKRCPEAGCPGELGVPVRQTGCPRRLPANRHTEKLESVLIVWEDVAVSREETLQLIDLACTWQDRRGMTVLTMQGELDLQAVQVLVAVHEVDGLLSPGSLERGRSLLIQTPGKGRRRLFIIAPPAGGAESQLSGPVRYVELQSGYQPTARKRSWFRRRG